ncbi:hypothetical protein ATANTOWER_020786 [Ataeniobius toweri]|uniref:Uncharacterized protein n=1 Tax=Ataeniobius toweri TaxID=208326 RepID=A0ABU7B026_9TELE|nr:hypothetical protein [Ataeniobius toweri]
MKDAPMERLQQKSAEPCERLFLIGCGHQEARHCWTKSLTSKSRPNTELFCSYDAWTAVDCRRRRRRDRQDDRNYRAEDYRLHVTIATLPPESAASSVIGSVKGTSSSKVA